MIEGQEYIEYYVDFKDGIKYRNQALDGYIFKLRGESSSGENILKFAPSANVGLFGQILLHVPWSIRVIG